MKVACERCNKILQDSSRKCECVKIQLPKEEIALCIECSRKLFEWLSAGDGTEK